MRRRTETALLLCIAHSAGVEFSRLCGGLSLPRGLFNMPNDARRHSQGGWRLETEPPCLCQLSAIVLIEIYSGGSGNCYSRCFFCRAIRRFPIGILDPGSSINGPASLKFSLFPAIRAIAFSDETVFLPRQYRTKVVVQD